MSSLLTPFEYEYMLKAILVSGLIGGVCAFLSCFITLKGWSLMGDALSHAVVPGVSLAWLLGLPFSVGAFVAGVLAALGMGWMKNHSRLREDAVIGVVFTTFFATGLLLLSLYPSNLNLRTIIFGNILAISDPDIQQVLIRSDLVIKQGNEFIACMLGKKPERRSHAAQNLPRPPDLIGTRSHPQHHAIKRATQLLPRGFLQVRSIIEKGLSIGL